MFQIWVNMLQMIPGISKNKAEQLATHYPSPTHLLEFVNDSRLTEEAIINILQEKLSNQEKKIKCKKLSKLLYTIFTTQDSSTSIL